MMLVAVISFMGAIRLKNFPYVSSFMFIFKNIFIFEIITQFFSFTIMSNCIVWFFKRKLTLLYQDKNLFLSLYSILFLYCLIQFANILLRTFASILSWVILAMSFVCLLACISYLWQVLFFMVMLALSNELGSVHFFSVFQVFVETSYHFFL